MKKKEKLKKIPTSQSSANSGPNINSILLRDLELRQVSSSPKSGFSPIGQGKVVSTFRNGHVGGDELTITEERSKWWFNVYSEDAVYDCDLGRYLDKWEW